MDSTLQKLQEKQEKNIHYGLADENRCLRSRLWERVIDRMFDGNFDRDYSPIEKELIAFTFWHKNCFYTLEMSFPKDDWHASDVTLYDPYKSVLIRERMKYRGEMNHPLLVRLWERIIEKIIVSGFKMRKHKMGYRLSFTIDGRDFYIIIQGAAAGTVVGDYYGKNFFLYDSRTRKKLLSEFIFDPKESDNPSHPLEELRALAFCSSEDRLKIQKKHRQLAQFA